MGLAARLSGQANVTRFPDFVRAAQASRLCHVIVLLRPAIGIFMQIPLVRTALTLVVLQVLVPARATAQGRTAAT